MADTRDDLVVGKSIQRIALVLEFDGSPYSGWQKQGADDLTVQQSVEIALTRVDGAPISTQAAGRTDAGVHAEALLVHCDVDAARWARSPKAYLFGVNQYLPESIRVVAAREVSAAFHARFDCLERAYRYQIWNRPIAPSIERWRHWWMPRKLDLSAMQQAAGFLLGEHDFSAFRATDCQSKTAMRDLRQVEISREGFTINISFRANAFLYHMVRNMVGTLVEVGVGKRLPDTIRPLMEGCDRRVAGATAPAHGLYFTNAVYEGFSSAALRESAGVLTGG